MNNLFFPVTFFLVFLTYSNFYVFFFLLFVGLFLDIICYPFLFFHTFFLLFFFLFNSYLKKVYHRKEAIFRTFLYTLFYFLCIFFLTRNFSFLFFFSQLSWNICFTFFIFPLKRISILSKT